MDRGAITVIGATTHPDLLPQPFRSRFAIRQDLEYYSTGDLVEILRRESKRLGVAIDEQAAGGPLGLGTLANRVGRTPGELLGVHEPLLIRRGLIVRTRRGRVLARPG